MPPMARTMLTKLGIDLSQINVEQIITAKVDDALAQMTDAHWVYVLGDADDGG